VATLICYNCPILTTIPFVFADNVYSNDCKWLYPNETKLNKLILIQRKCKKILQKRQKESLFILERYLPREVILYVIFGY